MNKSAQSLEGYIKLDTILICDSVKSLLTNEHILQVHSVFKHACNLQTKNKQLITFQSYDMPIVPRGCILPCDDLCTLFTQHQAIVVNYQNYLQWNNYQINLNTASQVNLQLKYPVVTDKLDTLGNLLCDFLPTNAPANGMYQILRGDSEMFPPVVLINIQSAIHDLKSWLQGQVLTNEQLTASLLHIVGFGIGLTPSADDFLVGILFVLDALNHPLQTQLLAVLPPLLSRTTDISHAMLDNAIQGRYAAQLLVLLNSSDLLSAIKQVAKYGHSSGHDMLCGIDFSLRKITSY